MENTKWKAKYDEGYYGIPIFSEPYKIKVYGMFTNLKGLWETTSLFLKSHGKRYMLTIDDGDKILTLEPMELKDYMKVIKTAQNIFPLSDIFLNPRNEQGAMTSDVIIYNHKRSIYEDDKEIGQRYVFEDHISKEKFMFHFYEEEEIEKLAQQGKNDIIASIDDIINNLSNKSDRKTTIIHDIER